MTTPLLLSIPDAGRTLGVGRSSAYELIRAGKLRVVHIGRRALVPRAEVERLYAELTGDRPQAAA